MNIFKTADSGGNPIDEPSSLPSVTITAAPTVTSVVPNNGSIAGATSLTINGTNLLGATAVHFGGNNAASFIVNGAPSIDAHSPAGSAGTVDITVTTPAGTSAISAGGSLHLQRPRPDRDVGQSNVRTPPRVVTR